MHTAGAGILHCLNRNYPTMKKNCLAIVAVLAACGFAFTSCQNTGQSGTTASSTETKTEKKQGMTDKKESTASAEKPGAPGAKASATPKGASGGVFGDAEEAKVLSKEEAEKSYPPPKGGYPNGEITSASGIYRSPYPPYKKFKGPRGALVLDSTANKVFVIP